MADGAPSPPAPAPPAYDLVVLGAGSGGVRAARFAASKYGKKVAIVELCEPPRPPPPARGARLTRPPAARRPFGFVSSEAAGGAGGTCVIRGCMPKKLFVYGAQFRGEFEDSRGFGWRGAEAAAPDWAAMLAKKNAEIERLNGVYGRILGRAGVEIFEGRGTVADRHTVEVALAAGGTARLTTAHILVATGGRAFVPDLPGKELAITSDEALVLPALPEQIVIVGGGYIAVEFAGIFAGFGVEVHLVYRRELPLRGFDEDCRALVAENLAKRGVTVHAEAAPVRLAEAAGGGVAVTLSGPGGAETTLTAGRVMFATGRRPASGGLGLEALGVALGPNGAVVVDEHSRTTVDGVWAVGDVTDRLNLTPVALMEGMAMAATAFSDAPWAPAYDNVASAVFCQPPLASVGLSEAEAVARTAGEVEVFVEKFRPMKATISGRDERSLMKLVVDVETDRVLGAHMVGWDAPEIMQGVAIALKSGATKATFDATVGIHPSSAEEFVTMRTPARRVQGTLSAGGVAAKI